MSKCIVTIKINDEEKEIPVEGSPSTLIDESVVEALSKNPEILKDLVEDLRKKLNQKNNLEPIKLKDILQEGVLANCTLNYLRESPEYCYLKFPDGNANILLVDKLRIGKTPMSGRVLKQNGEEIYIVQNNDEDLQRFANYLKAKNTIQQGVKITPDSSYYSEMNEILSKKKKKNEQLESIEDVLVDYISDKKSYSKIFLSNGKSAIQVLEKFIRNLRNYDTPLEFNDQFVTALNYNKFYKGDGQIYVSYDVLYTLFKQYYPVLMDSLGITSVSKFSEEISKEDVINVICSLIQDVNQQNSIRESLQTSANGHAALIKFALSTEPDFTFAYKFQSEKGITLEQQYTPISDKYGVTFGTIANMPSQKYRGYNIYDNDGVFFISRGTLTESNMSRKYSSVDEAKVDIEKIIEKQFLTKNSLIEFKLRESYTNSNGEKQYIESFPAKLISKTNFIEGQIIESLNVPIDTNTNIRGDEAHLLFSTNTTLSDFRDVVNTYKVDQKTKTYINQKINTPEKAALFIYKVNEQFKNTPRKNKEILRNIVDLIDNADYNYYYVESKQFVKQNGWQYKLIHLDKDQFVEAKKTQGKPIRLWLDAISVSLQNQFGVPIHIINSTEIESNFKGIADPNIDKAFIYNGEVYVNSSIASTNDLLHEHIHLILGVLKSNPELRKNYESLLNLVISTDEGIKELNRVHEKYSGLSEMDIREEVFANLFSNYMRNQTSIETQKVFDNSESEISKLTKSVFDTDIYDIKSFYGKSLVSIFSKFNKEVSKLMQGEIDFGSTKQTRIISNWISKQINEGLIKQEC